MRVPKRLYRRFQQLVSVFMTVVLASAMCPGIAYANDGGLSVAAVGETGVTGAASASLATEASEIGSSASKLTTQSWDASVVKQFSVGGQWVDSAVLLSDGTLWTWGRKDKGYLLDESSDYHTLPAKVMSDVSRFSLWYASGAAIKTDGSLWTWGSNDVGQLCDGTWEDRDDPAKVDALSGVVDVQMCGSPLALTSDGTLWRWGLVCSHMEGSTRVFERKATPQAFLRSIKSFTGNGDRGFAIDIYDNLWAWGEQPYDTSGNRLVSEYWESPTVVLHDVADVQLEIYNAAALTKDGSLYVWGSRTYSLFGNESGWETRLTPTTPTMEQVRSFSMSSNSITAVTREGALYYWGSSVSTPKLLCERDVRDSAASDGCVSFTKDDGSLWAMGRYVQGSYYSSKSVPEHILDNVATHSFQGTNIAVTNSGEIYVWGSNGQGTVGNGTTEDVLQPLKIFANGKWLYGCEDATGGNAAAQNEYTSADDFMIEQVGKYTSDRIASSYQALTESATNGEEYLRKSNLFFQNHGLTDASEGTKYLTESTRHRRAYLNMVDDQAYCAYNWYEWLYTTFWGTVARSSLYTSSLIFNYEAMAYFNPATYVLGDKPGVKKARELLRRVMLGSHEDSAVESVIGHAAKTADWLSRLKTINKEVIYKAENAADLAEMDRILDALLASKSLNDISSLTREYVGRLRIVCERDERVMKIDASGLSKAIGYAGTIISFADATIEDVVALMELENDVKTYLEYQRFLQTVNDSPDVSPDLRGAAWQLIDEMENGYFKKALRLCNDVLGLGKGVAEVHLDKSLVKVALEKADFESAGAAVETLGGAVDTISLATAIINLGVGVGDFVKEAAYTMGYAELSTLYSIKLREDHDAFLANRSAENAWKFFEDYTMLWELRYGGEKQYLNMNTAKVFIFAKVELWGYKWKEEVVNDTLSRLERYRFELQDGVDIPESVQYRRKAVIGCPVDVAVYADDGTPIALLKDGVESDVANEHGRFAVVRDSYSGDYLKVVCLSSDEDATIQAKAHDMGLVSMEYATAKGTADAAVYSLENVALETGDEIELSTAAFEAQPSCTVTAEGGKTRAEVPFSPAGSVGERTAVELVTLDRTVLDMTVGDADLLRVEVGPAAATSKAVGWLSSDDSVATVVDGKVTAVASGSASILCFSLDNSDAIAECTVSVQAKEEKPPSNQELADEPTKDNSKEKGNAVNEGGAPKVTPSQSAQSKDAISRGASVSKGDSEKKGTVKMAKNSMKVKTVKQKFVVKASKLEKRARKMKVLKVTGAKGKVTFKNVSKAKKFKKFKVNAKSGKLTVPKKTKKGTYKIKIRVTAAGDTTHAALAKSVTCKLRVK